MLEISTDSSTSTVGIFTKGLYMTPLHVHTPQFSIPSLHVLKIGHFGTCPVQDYVSGGTSNVALGLNRVNFLLHLALISDGTRLRIHTCYAMKPQRKFFLEGGALEEEYISFHRFKSPTIFDN